MSEKKEQTISLIHKDIDNRKKELESNFIKKNEQKVEIELVEVNPPNKEIKEVDENITSQIQAIKKEVDLMRKYMYVLIFLIPTLCLFFVITTVIGIYILLNK